MFRGFWVLRVLFMLLVLAALVGGGFLLYRAGFTNGFNTVASTTNSGNTAISPYHEFGHMGFGHMNFGPGRGLGFVLPGLGLLFGIGVFILFIFMIGGFFRMLFWRRWEGHNGPHGFGHHRHGHWSWNWDEQPEPNTEPGSGAGGDPNPK